MTEKVHGANFSFIYEDGVLRYAKRKAVLQWADDFFGFQLVVRRMEERIYQLFEALREEVDARQGVSRQNVVRQYIVYGELFGGAYPHPDVPAKEGLSAIQTGVYYSPDIEFCAFDIAVVTMEADQDKRYLDYQTAQQYFERYSVHYAKPLFIGKLSQAMEFNTRIDSTIPSLLQLPALSSNLIEGVVIKPYDQPMSSEVPRPILKVKNSEFAERKFHEAAKWSYLPTGSNMTADLSYILDEMKNYVTANRLESVLSKTGKIDRSDATRMQEIKEEFVLDVMTDFNEDNIQILAELEEAQRKWLRGRILAEVSKVVTT